MSPDNRHKLARPYWARPGIVSFAKKDDGGGKDDAPDDDDEEDDDDLDDDEEDDDDPDADKSEDDLRAELKAVRASLGKANGSSAKRRAKIKELNAELAKRSAPAPKGKGKAKDGDDDDAHDLDAEREAVRLEERAAAKKVRIADKAELALARANVDPVKLAKAVKLLDIDELDLDDDGALDGFDEQLEALKADWPELFTTKRGKRRSVAGDKDDDGRGKGAGKGVSASEAQAKVLTRR